MVEKLDKKVNWSSTFFISFKFSEKEQLININNVFDSRNLVDDSRRKIAENDKRSWQWSIKCNYLFWNFYPYNDWKSLNRRILFSFNIWNKLEKMEIFDKWVIINLNYKQKNCCCEMKCCLLWSEVILHRI